MVRAIVVGASGYVGRNILSALDDGVGTGNQKSAGALLQFDARTDSIKSLLGQLNQPVSHGYVCFGVSSPDTCYTNPDVASAVNVAAVKRTVDELASAGVVPVFLSTDYVFDGTRGNWLDDEAQCPNTEYGHQKAEVERWLQGQSGDWIIARLSKVVGSETDTHSVLGLWINDIRAGRTMRSATDQIFSPASVGDISKALVDLAAKKFTGTVNVAGEAISRYDLNHLLVEAVTEIDPSVNATLEKCNLSEIPFKETRPLNTSLNTDKLKKLLGWSFKSMAQYSQDVAATHFQPQSRKIS